MFLKVISSGTKHKQAKTQLGEPTKDHNEEDTKHSKERNHLSEIL